MGEEAVIDDELYSNIYDTMLHRLQDKIPSVRVQAVLALARLQDPRNKECPVIKGLLPPVLFGIVVERDFLFWTIFITIFSFLFISFFTFHVHVISLLYSIIL